MQVTVEPKRETRGGIARTTERRFECESCGKVFAVRVPGEK
jgi:hypothetical protein